MTLLGALAESAVRTLAFAGLVALALFVLRVTRPGVRLYSWTIVLYASVALFMAGWAMPSLHVPLPAIVLSRDLSPTAAPAPFVNDAVTHVRAEVPSSVARPAPETPRMQGSAAAEASHVPRPSWSVVALSIYIAGVAILFFHAGVGWVLTRRLERSARPIDDEATLTRVAKHATATGLQRVPRLATSDRLLVPVATSVLRPMIVLPGNWCEWSAAKLDAVLAHEIAHVARRDAFTQRLSLIYRAVSWFNPFSWWLHRRLGDLAEQVSDEAALGAGVEGIVYAETLLGFLADRVSCPPRRADWHVAMVHGAGAAAEQRVERILAWDGRRSRTLTRSFVLGVALAAAPAVLLAAAVRPEVVNLRVMDLPVVAAPGLGQAAGPRLLAMPAATSAPASGRPQIPTPAPAPSPAAQSQASASPALTVPITDASQDLLTKESIAFHGVWVLLFDLSSMAPWDAHRAVSAAVKWTDETMSPTDLVAVLSMASTLQVPQDFTNDKAKIHAALDEFAKGIPTTNAQGRTNDTRLRSLKTVCDNLGNIQQHKTLLYFSSGMQRDGTDNQDEVRAMEQSCFQAHVSIDPVDARGLLVAPPTQASSVPAPTATQADTTPSNSRFAQTDLVLVDVSVGDATGQPIGDLGPTEFQIFEDDVKETLTFFEVSVGGRNFATGQSVGPPLYYVLGYTSTNHSSSVGYRQIRVEVSRPGVTVTARKGYYGGTDQLADGTYPEDTPDLVKPVVRERREASYTSEAMRAKIQGDVVIEAVVGVDGRITRARVAGSLEPSLDEQALSAVRQWTFTPGELKGVKVPVLVQLVVAFRLH